MHSKAHVKHSKDIGEPMVIFYSFSFGLGLSAREKRGVGVTPKYSYEVK